MDKENQSENRVTRLNNNNYRSWKIEMRWYLTGKGLLDHVLTQVHIEDCASAYEAWSILEQVHQPKSRVRITQLKKEFYHLRMRDDENMPAYLASAKIAVTNL
ncbi:uncharacterized protein LOC123988557 isoform X1 [Osmia bicornis bicornis]|uniref:uncharacterized protein LOC123988557 isoform X1 n=1 Tax=Osmia bicornis bicornis TaxID=1437191 RepID=UPI001EAECAA3|nr:uncharacterized protein LOC123988557 isoform X1 [Osmia bicornis bicornis]